MNIQKINSTQNFGVLIGPKLQAEIEIWKGNTEQKQANNTEEPLKRAVCIILLSGFCKCYIIISSK